MTYDLTKVSARRAVLGTLLDEWKKVRGGAYRAHRGVVDFVSYPWDEVDRAVCIFMFDETFGRAMNDGTVGFQVFGRIRDRKPGASDKIDDSLIDEMKDDAITVVNAMVAAKDAKGDSLIYLFMENSATMEEAYSIEAGIEGVIMSFEIQF